MNIQDILSKAAGVPLEALRALILAGVKASPDLAPQAEALLKWMDSAATPEALIELASTILAEANDIAKGKVTPKDHPSDAA